MVFIGSPLVAPCGPGAVSKWVINSHVSDKFMKCQIRIGPFCFQPGCRKPGFFVCLFCVIFVFGCYFMQSVPMQLIVWKDRPQNDLLCREGRYAPTHSLTLPWCPFSSFFSKQEALWRCGSVNSDKTSYTAQKYPFINSRYSGCSVWSMFNSVLVCIL